MDSTAFGGGEISSFASPLEQVFRNVPKAHEKPLRQAVYNVRLWQCPINDSVRLNLIYQMTFLHSVVSLNSKQSLKFYKLLVDQQEWNQNVLIFCPRQVLAIFVFGLISYGSYYVVFVLLWPFFLPIMWALMTGLVIHPHKTRWHV